MGSFNWRGAGGAFLRQWAAFGIAEEFLFVARILRQRRELHAGGVDGQVAFLAGRVADVAGGLDELLGQGWERLAAFLLFARERRFNFGEGGDLSEQVFFKNDLALLNRIGGLGQRVEGEA